MKTGRSPAAVYFAIEALTFSLAAVAFEYCFQLFQLARGDAAAHNGRIHGAAHVLDHVHPPSFCIGKGGQR